MILNLSAQPQHVAVTARDVTWFGSEGKYYELGHTTSITKIPNVYDLKPWDYKVIYE